MRNFGGPRLYFPYDTSSEELVDAADIALREIKSSLHKLVERAAMELDDPSNPGAYVELLLELRVANEFVDLLRLVDDWADDLPDLAEDVDVLIDCGLAAHAAMHLAKANPTLTTQDFVLALEQATVFAAQFDADLQQRLLVLIAFVLLGCPPETQRLLSIEEETSQIWPQTSDLGDGLSLSRSRDAIVRSGTLALDGLESRLALRWMFEHRPDHIHGVDPTPNGIWLPDVTTNVIGVDTTGSVPRPRFLTPDDVWEGEPGTRALAQTQAGCVLDFQQGRWVCLDPREALTMPDPVSGQNPTPEPLVKDDETRPAGPRALIASEIEQHPVLAPLSRLMSKHELKYKLLRADTEAVEISTGFIRIVITETDAGWKFETTMAGTVDQPPEELLRAVLSEIGTGYAAVELTPRRPVQYGLDLPRELLSEQSVHDAYRWMIRGHLALLHRLLHNVELQWPSQEELRRWGLERNGEMWQDRYLEFNMQRMG